MKRGRDQTPEEEPLTKRINNLHLDGSSQLLSQVLNGSPLSAPPPCAPLTQDSLLNGLAAAGTLPGCDMVQAAGALQGIAHNAAGLGHPGGAGPSQVGAPNNLGELEEMISRRELPESLSVTYPDLNPTTNHQYFAFNKLLHHLHLERLRRAGKLPL